MERRKARRFAVGWDVTVSGTDSAGLSFGEKGVLENLSSNGAYLYLSRTVAIGERLTVLIKVPFKRENWMRYTAEVVRAERAEAGIGIAMKFNGSKPEFVKI